jgi:hypothetical protein
LRVIQVFGEGICESDRGNGVFGKAAINGPPGKLRSAAQILSICSTEPAHSARPVEPGHTYALPHLKPGSTIAEGSNPSDDLMPGNNRGAPARQFTLHYMQVGATDATS